MGNGGSIRLLVVLRDNILRRALVDTLSSEETFNIVHSTSIIDACVLLDLIQQHKVNIVLLHADSDSRTVCKCTRILCRMNHDARTIISGLPSKDSAIISAIESGASGIATDNTNLDELVANIAAIAQGDTLCTPHVAGLLFSKITENSAHRGTSSQRSRITRREREVVVLIEQGLTNKAIATELSIEVQTVKNHVHNILEKLDLKRRTQVARYAREEGWFNAGTSTSTGTDHNAARP